MLIGGHVSTAGGLERAIERGRGARLRDDAGLQPEPARMAAARSTPTPTSRRSGSGSRESPVKSVYIHAVYLINVASDDAEVRRKSLDITDARAVGRRRDRGGRRDRASRERQGPGPGPTFKKLGKAMKAALAETESVPAAVREHRRRRVHDRSHVRGAGAGDRRCRARASGSACAWTRAICWRPATRCATRHAFKAVVDEYERDRRASTGCARCT